MMNTVSLVGKLVDIPEMKNTNGGVKVANATLQVERPFKNSLGAFENDYIVVSLWRGIAELIIEKGQPGSLLAVKGRLRSRTFESSEGSSITSIEVIAERVTLLDKYLSNRR